MIRAKVTFYDDRTGEVIAEEDRVLFVGRKPYYDRGFVKIFVAFLRDIIELKDLGSGPLRLLLYVIENLDYDSLEVYIDPKVACRRLKVGKSTFYRWLGVLLKYRILEKRDTRIYRLRPYSAVKGQMTKLKEPDF